MNKGILILGKGFIGSRLHRELGGNIDGSRIDCLHQAQKLINRYKPAIIINCIGVNGKRNVDDCELDKDAVLLANSFVPVILAEACLRNKVKFIQISSGCIFNYTQSKKPVREDSRDYFLKLFYSRSKIYAERAIEVLARDYDILILRIRIPLSDARHPKNLLDKLVKYKKVITLPNSVTYVPDFVRAVKYLIRIKARGTYNVVNKGGLRYSKLMQVYQKYVPAFKYRQVEFSKLGLVRTNLLMSAGKLEKSGFKVRDINSVLEECVKNYLKS